jgi:hypothetical protein
MTGDTQNPLSLALTLWLMTPVFWIVIAILFLGLELINRRLVLFLPVTISSLIIAVMAQPIANGWTPFPFMTPGPALTMAIWVVLALLASGICLMVRRKVSRQRSRRRRLTRD